MRYSDLFTKTIKQVPADESAKNARLLIQAGYIHKEMAGVYAYLPLGLKVLENIKQIVRGEIESIGGQELILTNLQPKEPWQETNRWDSELVDVWFKTKLQDETEIGLAWSHEEPIMEIMRHYAQSYKDFPISVYQFQTKLRNELRAKSGIMRGREFLMKDMYSLHTSQKDMDDYYERVIQTYKKIYNRLGIGDSTFVTFASGGAFTKFSHEFQTICDVGEDVLHADEDHSVAVNEEVLADAVKELGIDKSKLKPVKSAEVGNIFKFGTEKSEQMGIHYTDKAGTQQPIYLASYGIGVSRVMGVIVEKFADDKGLVWPENIAPFQVYLAVLGADKKVQAEAEKLYKNLQQAGIEVLYDDRDARPGEKFADADLIGLPYRAVVSEKAVAKNKIELKHRKSDKIELLEANKLVSKLVDLKKT